MNRTLRWVGFGLLGVRLGWAGDTPVIKTATSNAPVVVCVGTFSSGAGDAAEPFAAAVSDLLTTCLTHHPDVRVVDRQHLGSVMREQTVTAAGLADAATAARIGHLVGATRIVTGSALVLRDEATIAATVLDVDSGVVQAGRRVSGKTSGLVELTGQLADGLAQDLRLKPLPAAQGPVEEHPESSLYYLRGLGYFHAGNYDHALMDFMGCEDIQPDHRTAAFWRGRCYERLQDYAHARIEFARFLRRAPDAAEAGAAAQWLKECDAKAGPEQSLLPPPSTNGTARLGQAQLEASNAGAAPAASAKKPEYVAVTCKSEQAQIRQHVRELLRNGDFDMLTRLARQYRSSKATLSDGSWTLNHFYEAFSHCSSTQEWNAMFGRLEEWNRHESADPAPIVAIGNAYWSFGKQARGTGFADSVTPEGWKLLHERLAKGRGRLVGEFSRCKSCPGYYVVMMKLGIDGSQQRDSFMKLFDQGIALEPAYPHMYEMKAYYILPRWYGRRGEIREFIFAVADRHPQAALWVLWRLQQGVYQNVFKQEGIEWDAIEVKLKRCLELNPVGIGQANMLAYLSDVAGDAETLAAALKSVDGKLDASLWQSRKRLDEIADRFSGTGP